MSKFSFQFNDPLCEKLYSTAQPKGYMNAFAWRENNKGLDKSWSAWTKGWTQEKKEEFLDHLLDSAQAQTRYRKAQIESGKELGRPRGIAVWFNACGWDDEIGSHSELRQAEKKEFKGCRLCGKKVFEEPDDTLCAWHWTLKHKDDPKKPAILWPELEGMRDKLGLNPLPNETKEDRRRRCIETALSLGFKV